MQFPDSLMPMLSRLQIRTKLALVMTLLLAVMSIAIYVYFPEKLQRQAIDAMTEQARAVADMTAFSVAAPLHENDNIAVVEALTGLRRNPDLVFQARVPGYRIDDWQKVAYTDRLVYDAWDKQACLIPTSEWPMRALVRSQYRPYHDRQILEAELDAVSAVLAEIKARGPLSPLEFEDRSSAADDDTWFGSTRTKRILRSLWACGQVVTHHRKNGRHYYDLPERVIPAQYFNAPPLLDRAAYHRWLITQRHQAIGILRPSSEASIWSASGEAKELKIATQELVESGILIPVKIGEKAWPYHMLTNTLKLFDAPLPASRMIFLAPLDNMLWDRKGILQIFDFDYLWEVYKPEHLRKWGNSVIPAFYETRFIAGSDQRSEKGP